MGEKRGPGSEGTDVPFNLYSTFSVDSNSVGV
jgi:hypothetical protein